MGWFCDETNYSDRSCVGAFCCPCLTFLFLHCLTYSCITLLFLLGLADEEHQQGDARNTASWPFGNGEGGNKFTVQAEWKAKTRGEASDDCDDYKATSNH
jgi:hypothetical protein